MKRPTLALSALLPAPPGEANIDGMQIERRAVWQAPVTGALRRLKNVLVIP